jgi:hypothetical protein
VNWLESMLEPVGGALLVLLATGLMFAFAIPRRAAVQGKSRAVLHSIVAMQRLRRAIGLAVRMGRACMFPSGNPALSAPTMPQRLPG